MSWKVFVKVMEVIRLFGWGIGNILIFSGMLYLSYEVINEGVPNWDSFLITIIMIIWVFGQLDYSRIPEFEK